MTWILDDLSDESLARASKESLWAFFRAFEQVPDCDTDSRGGLYRWISGVAHPWFNGILLDRSPAEGDVALLDSLVLEMVERERPYTLWPANEAMLREWGPLLKPPGYVNDGEPGMAIELAHLPELPELPAGFSIRRLEGIEAIEVWAATVMEGNQLPPWFCAPFQALVDGLCRADPENFINYLGLLDGRPVATSHLFFGAGVAGIQFVATLHGMRRRGFGGMMTLAPLHEARARGYRAAVLQASPDGRPVYRRLGFREVGIVGNFHLPTHR